MKLSSYRRIYDQDYQGPNQELIKQIALPINSSFTELYDLCNNNLTFTDNFLATVNTFTVTVDASGNPSNNTQFKLNSSQVTLTGIIVINAFGSKDSTVSPISGVFVSFKKNNNFVLITNVTGLKSGIPYKITVIALG